MQSYKFKLLIWEFNALIDTGKYDEITIEEVKDHIRAGAISKFLQDRFGKEADFSVMQEADWLALSEEWKGMVDAFDEGRKMGVYNRGLCFLLAYSMDCFQRRETSKAA